MGKEALEIVVLVVLALLLGGVALVLRRWRLASRPKPEPVQPRSLVRILETREDFEEAVRRAAAYEHKAAMVLQQRADRYDALIADHASITDIRTAKPLTTTESDEARPA